MAMLDLRYLGDPVLRETAAEVDAFDDDLRRLARDMMDTMYAADGVGLAAPQVGILRRLVVIDTREEGVEPLVLVNPRLVEVSEELEKGEEGCLSIPGLQELVERPTAAVVEALDLEGETFRIDAEGMLSRALQHEIDHLNGVLFIDRLSPLKRRLLLRKWEKVRSETV